jgi:hypothetical protein
MCKHLAREMPKESVRETPIHYVDQYPAPEQDKTEFTEFRQKLRKFGLEEIRIDILTLRFIYEWTFADIADYLYIPNRQTAFNIYKDALQLLKERGYKL